ncbi:SdpI/YhfL family protein [Natranaerovirga pectinivora]|uniref:SdpI/YhfL family protein n=1 Tax=Natranaerovirga pectinivora TaxID=682400 RepID=A0A4R3MPC0_9FIRM|nr:SdpI family protein [Natranaerovirga pectinivora]TCT17135.1 SdpI/YhfL family protein [Natranaerovirga pectinivora]
MLIISLIMTAIICLSMIGFGFLMVKKPPKEINALFGYRTAMSSKNKDTWVFAHRYSGKIWIRSGIITGIISVILAFALQGLSNYNLLLVVICYIQIIVLLLVIPFTAAALRKTFDKNGNRK